MATEFMFVGGEYDGKMLPVEGEPETVEMPVYPPHKVTDWPMGLSSPERFETYRKMPAPDGGGAECYRLEGFDAPNAEPTD